MVWQVMEGERLVIAEGSKEIETRGKMRYRDGALQSERSAR
jgi:hypothetical protein